MTELIAGAIAFVYDKEGMLTSVRALAGHPWYKEGAEVLLKAQKPDGSWEAQGIEDANLRVAFALLFLARSTRSEYAVGEAGH